MKIDGNEKEKRALAAYYAGDKETYRKLQDEFVEEVRQAIANRENICPCKVQCIAPIAIICRNASIVW